MNRRSLLSFIGALPIVGGFAKSADGVALRSIAHPIGPQIPFDAELRGIITSEILLTSYAHIGDLVTCENGHPICEFVEDVCIGQSQLPKHLGGWTQDEPEIGAVGAACVLCGGAFYAEAGVFHFKDGWRR